MLSAARTGAQDGTQGDIVGSAGSGRYSLLQVPMRAPEKAEVIDASAQAAPVFGKFAAVEEQSVADDLAGAEWDVRYEVRRANGMVNSHNRDGGIESQEVLVEAPIVAKAQRDQ